MQYKKIFASIVLPTAILASWNSHTARAEEIQNEPKFSGEVATSMGAEDKEDAITAKPSAKFKLGAAHDVKVFEGCDMAEMRAKVSVGHDGKKASVNLLQAFVSLPLCDNYLVLKMGRDDSVFNDDQGTWQLGLSSKMGTTSFVVGLNVEQAAPTLYWLDASKKKTAENLINEMIEKDPADPAYDTLIPAQYDLYLNRKVKTKGDRAFRKVWAKTAVGCHEESAEDVPVALVPWVEFEREKFIKVKAAAMLRLLAYDKKVGSQITLNRGFGWGTAVSTTWTAVPDWTKLIAGLRLGKGICYHIGEHAAKYAGKQLAKIGNKKELPHLWGFALSVESSQFLIKDTLEFTVKYTAEAAGEKLGDVFKKADQGGNGDIAWGHEHIIAPTLKYHLLDKQLRLDLGGSYNLSAGEKGASENAYWGVTLGIKANFG